MNNKKIKRVISIILMCVLTFGIYQTVTAATYNYSFSASNLKPGYFAKSDAMFYVSNGKISFTISSVNWGVVDDYVRVGVVSYSTGAQTYKELISGTASITNQKFEFSVSNGWYYVMFANATRNSKPFKDNTNVYFSSEQ